MHFLPASPEKPFVSQSTVIANQSLPGKSNPIGMLVAAVG